MMTSANNTAILPAFFNITDASGNVWAIAPNGQITINGIADPSTANVIELAYVNGQVWQENNQHLWWEKTTTAPGQWNFEGTTNPLNGAAFTLGYGEWPSYAGPQPTTISINHIIAYSFSNIPASQLQVIPALTRTAANDVYLWHDNYEVTGHGSSMLIRGNSSIADGSTLRLDGTTVGDSPMYLENDGTMYVSGSTLYVGPLSGHGAIVASGGSVLDLQSTTAGETIQLNSSHLYIGGAQGISPHPGPQSFGMNFLAPITNFGAGSSIVVDNTVATAEVFAKTSLTSGDLMLFNGATEVANLHISGAMNIYAQNVAGAVVLTSTDPGAHLPTWVHY